MLNLLMALYDSKCAWTKSNNFDVFYIELYEHSIIFQVNIMERNFSVYFKYLYFSRLVIFDRFLHSYTDLIQNITTLNLSSLKHNTEISIFPRKTYFLNIYLFFFVCLFLNRYAPKFFL